MRNSGVAYLLWALCLFGIAGAHRFYLDRPGGGVLWFMTWGFCGIAQAIDLALIPSMVAECNRRFRSENQTKVIVIHRDERVRDRDIIRDPFDFS